MSQIANALPSLISTSSVAHSRLSACRHFDEGLLRAPPFGDLRYDLLDVTPV